MHPAEAAHVNAITSNLKDEAEEWVKYAHDEGASKLGKWMSSWTYFEACLETLPGSAEHAESDSS